MAPKPSVQSKKHVARLERERRQVRLILWITAGVVLAVIGLLTYGYLDLTYLQERRPVAIVNGEEISTKEFQARVTIKRNQLLTQYVQYYQLQQMGMDYSAQLQQMANTLDAPLQTGQDVLDGMIDEILLRQDAERRGITISDDELQTFIQDKYGFFPNGSPTPTVTATLFSFPTLSEEQLVIVTPTSDVTSTPSPTSTPDPSFTATPTIPPTATATSGPSPTPFPTETPYTKEGFEQDFENSISNVVDLGLTEAQYRMSFKTEMLINKLYEEVTADVPKVKEQIWARHILVSSEEVAQSVVVRLKAGEDFGEIAKELSEDPGSAQNGGDLEWFDPDTMIPEFADACRNLEIGEISDPVETQYGYHIIQKLGQADVPLTASQWEADRQQAFSDYLTKLRDESEIEKVEGWEDKVPTSPSLQDLLGQVQ